jgi:hypothetical protein
MHGLFKEMQAMKSITLLHVCAVAVFDVAPGHGKQVCMQS